MFDATVNDDCNPSFRFIQSVESVGDVLVVGGQLDVGFEMSFIHAGNMNEIVAEKVVKFMGLILNAVSIPVDYVEF